MKLLLDAAALQQPVTRVACATLGLSQRMLNANVDIQ
jgi:hypothetical protein